MEYHGYKMLKQVNIPIKEWGTILPRGGREQWLKGGIKVY